MRQMWKTWYVPVFAHALGDGLMLADALVAATAIENGLTLAPSNVKHFRVVKGLGLVAVNRLPQFEQPNIGRSFFNSGTRSLHAKFIPLNLLQHPRNCSLFSILLKQ
jgi:hypothetical protein